MSVEKPVILILEDSKDSSELYSQAISRDIPSATVLQAGSVAEAQEFVGGREIDVFVTDINLPDGSGMDFLCDILTTLPGARAIVITGEPLVEYRHQVNELGVVAFLVKPFHSAPLSALVYRQLALAAAEANAAPPARAERPAATPAAEPGGTAFIGAISRVTPADLIQMKCLGKATQVIEFGLSDGTSGRIHIVNGHLVHSQTPANTGPEALREIVHWTGGVCREVSVPGPAQPTLSGEWQMLLMDALG